MSPGHPASTASASAGLQYDGFYQRFRRDLVQLLLSVKASSGLDIARYAFDQTAFYRRHYGQEPADFPSLPLVTRELLAPCDPYDLLAADLVDEVTGFAQTRGTAGPPLPLFVTRGSRHLAVSLVKTSPFVADLEAALDQNRAVLLGLGGSSSAQGLWFTEMLGGMGAVVAVVDPSVPGQCVDTLLTLRPSVVVAQIRDFLAWEWLAMNQRPAEHARSREHLRILVNHGETLSASRRRFLANEFGLQVIDVYAAAEGFGAVPCPCGELHLLPIHEVELADAQGRLIGPLGEGRLVFTNLLRASTPMIRYLLDDYVTIADSRCPHRFARSLTVRGRFRETILLGDRRVGVLDFAESIYTHGLLGDFRVEVQPRQVTLRIEVLTRSPDPANIVASVRERIGIEPVIELVPFGELTPLVGERRNPDPRRIHDRRPPAAGSAASGAPPPDPGSGPDGRANSVAEPTIQDDPGGERPTVAAIDAAPRPTPSPSPPTLRIPNER